MKMTISQLQADWAVFGRVNSKNQFREVINELLMMLGSGMIRLVGKSVLAFCSICIIFSSLSFYEIYSEEKAILSTLRRWNPKSVLSNQYSILWRSYIVLYVGMRSYSNPLMRRNGWRREFNLLHCLSDCPCHCNVQSYLILLTDCLSSLSSCCATIEAELPWYTQGQHFTMKSLVLQLVFCMI